MTSHQLQMLFVDLALILVLARALGALAERIGQPPVVGEILAGILLGPSLLPEDVTGTLFPSDVRPLLRVLADLGVLLFMFGMGLEIESRALRGGPRVIAGAVVGSTLVPFVLGLGLGWYFLRSHPHDQSAVFVVFIGLSVSVTAFPVLARILADRGLAVTSVGVIALATAAIVDLVAWTALAGVQAAATGAGEQWRMALFLPYLAVMLLVIRPLLRRMLVREGTGGGRSGPFTEGILSVVLIGTLLSGAAAEAIGLHYIFGAFLFGLIMPREGVEVTRADIRDRLGQLGSLLLPVYFVVAGLQVDLRELNLGGFAEVGLVLLVAILGKVGGTYLGSRTQGLRGRPAVRLAVLMNTRGLTELIILGVGLELGLLDRHLYSVLVVMALVTTALTGPLLALLDGRRATSAAGSKRNEWRQPQRTTPPS